MRRRRTPNRPRSVEAARRRRQLNPVGGGASIAIMPGRERSSWRNRRARHSAEMATSEQLTQAFFACERAFDQLASAGITALRHTGASPAAQQQWGHLQHRFETVLSVYLALNQADPARMDHAAAARCIHDFRALESDLQRFADHHRALLAEAASTAAAARDHQERAVLAADQAQVALTDAPPSIAGLSTIASAAAELGRRRASFDRAVGLADRTRAAGPLQSGAQALQALLAEAPGYTAEAQRVLQSLTTRVAGVQNRLSLLPQTLSTLRREFSADCSRDLEGAPAEIGHALGHAQQLLDEARTLEPDRVITRAGTIRDHLDVADDLLRTVVERLRVLQSVRTDPATARNTARFRIRDAQRFAVSHGLVDQWGSVLDAQSDRLDRAASLLERVHPDYWSYLEEIGAVEKRIADTVARMRAQLAR